MKKVFINSSDNLRLGWAILVTAAILLLVFASFYIWGAMMLFFSFTAGSL